VKSNGDLLYLPEVLRTRGAILAHPAVGQAGAAEACFAAAMDLARRQSALVWELRAATSLARLRAGQNRLQEAHGLLAPVRGRFREGFSTADPVAADALLRRSGRMLAGPGIAARPPLRTLS
jgi:predicted ATPase